MALRLRRRARGRYREREGGGRREREGVGEEGRGWLCALGAEHVKTTMAQEEDDDGAGRGPQMMMVEAG